MSQKERKVFYINKPLCNKLSKKSKENGLSMSEIVRRALESYFMEMEKTELRRLELSERT